MAVRKEDIVKAKEALFNHGVVCFPTETVMGLGVLYNDYEAYIKLNKVKRRPEDKPYTLMVKSKEDLHRFGIINENTLRVIDAFMPGSLTILVPLKEGSVSEYVTHGGSVIGMRIPTNEESVALLQEVKEPLLVPSANRSGEKPSLTSQEAMGIFGKEVDFYLPGEAQKDVPSTIVDLTKGTPRVVREGPISKEEILKVWNKE